MTHGLLVTRSKAARGGNSVYSGAVNDESSSLEVVMEEVNNSAEVPLCVKRALAKFMAELQSVVRERDDLREENRILRKKFGIPEDLDVRSDNFASFPYPSQERSVQLNDLSVPPNSVDPHEFERRRSVIISGIPELRTGNIARKLNYDYDSVLNVIHHLKAECFPTAVYRLGRPEIGKSRLLKVIFLLLVSNAML
ncbi:hypothetical protein Y032_0352g3284 [Ancylostoma ceylanicum]|uniref:Uncharacterized protein n=1 Tax=Ancylostoma ceylanicum TaxID=53326 RepID=A0A016RWP2_9BILA|nr:hypothetical protein Y032_0352g3284 [Ancylostoma ceylanicum]